MKKIFTILFIATASVCFNHVNAATFSSVASGTWSTPATWAITSGTDADGKPDLDDDVTINSGHSVSFTTRSAAHNLIISASGLLVANSQIFDCYGNFTVSGSVSGAIYPFFYSNTGVFSSSSSFSNTGDWYFISGTLTIAAGTTISKTNYFKLSSGANVINLGTVDLYGGSLTLNGTSNWTNSTNSILNIARNLTGTGTLIASANGNTINYKGSQVYTVIGTTYYNLSLDGGSTKVATANIQVLNNFSFGSYLYNILNLNNFNLSVGGNWTNSANSTITNQGTITFNGSGTQTLSRTTGNEVINNMVLSGTGTVQLARSLNIMQSLLISSGTLDVSASNYTVNVAGSLTNNSIINPRQGLFNFNGTSAQTISGSTNTQFYNLTLNNSNGLTISSAQSLSNILTVTAGNFNANGNFTLISNASTTARIAPVIGTISGNMTIQKYISARVTNYHDFSSPVSSTTIMDWDDELYMSGIGNDDGTPGPAGVDGGAAGTGSVYTFDESQANAASQGWIQVSGSATSIVSGKGYEIYLGLNQTNFTATTIDTKGVPFFGSKTVNLGYTAASGTYAGANLVGNPFASAVTYSACSKTNVTGNILILDDSGNYTDYGSNPTIPAHQGFWITASGAGASITFPESSKATTTATSFYRTLPNYGIKLLLSSPILPFYHENTINFSDNSTLGYDKELDALFMKSPNKNAPSIYMLTNTDARLITNNINSQSDDITIPLGIFTPEDGVYYIEPTLLNTVDYNHVWIENTKTGEKYDLTKSISISGKQETINTDYSLRLSKLSANSVINQSIFNNDLMVFSTENSVNIKSINTSHIITNLSIYDISGKLLHYEDGLLLEAGQTTKIDISSFPQGVYVINLTDNQGNQKTQKIMR